MLLFANGADREFNTVDVLEPGSKTAVMLRACTVQELCVLVLDCERRVPQSSKRYPLLDMPETFVVASRLVSRRETNHTAQSRSLQLCLDATRRLFHLRDPQVKGKVSS